MSRSTRWSKPITAYSPHEKRALTFLSKDDRERAIHLCWHDPDLAGVPRGIADGMTLVVPEEAVLYFESKGLNFRISQILSQDDLSPEECSMLRRKYGM